jgi:hypothetical protein
MGTGDLKVLFLCCPQPHLNPFLPFLRSTRFGSRGLCKIESHPSIDQSWRAQSLSLARYGRRSCACVRFRPAMRACDRVSNPVQTGPKPEKSSNLSQKILTLTSSRLTLHARVPTSRMYSPDTRSCIVRQRHLCVSLVCPGRRLVARVVEVKCHVGAGAIIATGKCPRQRCGKQLWRPFQHQRW